MLCCGEVSGERGWDERDGCGVGGAGGHGTRLIRCLVLFIHSLVRFLGRRMARRGKIEEERGGKNVPRRLLTDEKVGGGLVDAKANLIALLSDVLVSERLERGEKERAGCWEVSDCEADVGDWHFGSLL